MYKRMPVATDGSPASSHGLGEACNLGKDSHFELMFVGPARARF